MQTYVVYTLWIAHSLASTVSCRIIRTNNNSKTMFIVLSSWQSHCESSPGSFDECRTAPSGRRRKTKLDDLGCESAYTGCQSLHPPSPFITTTHPESWCSFYRPTEGRRLSRPSWLVTYQDGLPVHIRVSRPQTQWREVSRPKADPIMKVWCK